MTKQELRGKIKYTLHEFAREFYGISDEEYNFWTSRSHEQLNNIYNEAWTRYKGEAIDFYKYGTEYSLGTTFKQIGGGISPGWSGKKNECMVPTIYTDVDSVLDYACGLGEYSIGFYHYGSKLTLADIDSPIFRMIRKYYGYCKGWNDIEFIGISEDETDYVNKLLGDRKWDMVICLNALHHMKNGNEVLKILASKTKKYLVVNTDFNSGINLHISNINLSVLNEEWENIDNRHILTFRRRKI